MVAGRYRVVRTIGAGSMGTVYEAEHSWTSARVALKVLHAELGRNEKLVSRFLREARAGTRVTHDHVAAVLDMGQDESDGSLYLAQTLIVGRDLRGLFRERGPLPPREALALLRPIAEALSAVHAAGVIHRDVKPENIMLRREADGSETPVLIDFGIARELDREATVQTQLGLSIGTPRYMAPEQARGDDVVDARADQWSFAAVLYEAMSGRAPFDESTVAKVIAKVLTEPAPSLAERCPSAPSALVAAVDRALSSKAESRHASMDAFVTALDAAMLAQPKRSRDRRPLALLAALTLAAVGAIASQRYTAATEPRARGTSVAPEIPRSNPVVSVVLTDATVARSPDAALVQVTDVRAIPPRNNVRIALRAVATVDVLEAPTPSPPEESAVETTTPDAGSALAPVGAGAVEGRARWLQPTMPR